MERQEESRVECRTGLVGLKEGVSEKNKTTDRQNVKSNEIEDGEGGAGGEVVLRVLSVGNWIKVMC